MREKQKSELAVDTWDALKGASWPIFQAIGECTRQIGSTPAQISLLFVLFQAETTMTPLAVARILGVTPGTVTGTLNPLEDMGLIERARGESADRRVVNLRLTPKGREHLKTWLASCRVVIDRALAPVSDDDKRALIAILSRIGPPEVGVPKDLVAGLDTASGGRSNARDRSTRARPKQK